MTWGQNRATPKPLLIVDGPARIKTFCKYDWVVTRAGIVGSVQTIEQNPFNGGVWVKIVSNRGRLQMATWAKWEDVELYHA